LDELEAVELRISEVLVNNESFRIDAEYFKKEYLKEDTYRNKYQNVFLEEIAFITDGQHGYHEVDNSSKISHIIARNTKNWFADNINSDKLAEWVDKKNKRSSLVINDILFSTRGTVGQCAIVSKDILPANIDQDLVRIELLVNYVSPYYLLTYMNSKFGQDWAKRNASGMVQQGIPILKMKKFLLPLINYSFQLKIESLVQSAQQKLEKSKTLYKEAETILLKELDLLDFEPTQENIAIKSFSESFLVTGRLDSEYYQPKYDEIVEKIKSYRGGVETIESACNLKDSNHKPIHEKHYQYIELSNIGTTGDITGFTYNVGKKLPSRARRLVKENDVIISSIEGSLGKVALVTKVFNDSLCSTGFYVLNSDKINSETLLVLFKNRMIQQILKQNCSGTILTGMNKDEFLNIVVPIIDLKIQIQISEKIKTSFQLKSESIELLALAKRAVEVAIEEGEDVALELIGENYE
jgi:restriction endonuclease S subunit